MEGWIKVHRKIIDSRVFGNPEMLKLWLLCLTKASYRKRYVKMPGLSDPIKISPGQFVIGRHELHNEYYSNSSNNEKSDRTLWRWIKKLEDWGCLSIKSSNKYSLVTIVNWDKYQNSENGVQQNDQQMTNSRPTNDQQVSTNNKGKKDNNDKNNWEFVENYDFDFPKQLTAIDGFEQKYQKWCKYLDQEHDKKLSHYSAEEELRYLAELNQQGHPPKKVISQAIRNRYKSLQPLNVIANTMNDNQAEKGNNRSKDSTCKHINVDSEDITNTEKGIRQEENRLREEAQKIQNLDWHDGLSQFSVNKN